MPKLKKATKRYSVGARVQAYNTAFPNWPPLQEVNGKLYGVWVLGNDYKNKSKLYGAYPPNYLKRLMSLFPDMLPSETLHLFSGSLSEAEVGGAWRFDRQSFLGIKDMPKIGDAHELSNHYPENAFNLVVADPPYTADDQKKYGLDKMVNKKKVLHEVASILAPGGYLCWLDTFWPMFTKTEFELVGTIGIWRSINHRIRGVSIFKRV